MDWQGAGNQQPHHLGAVAPIPHPLITHSTEAVKEEQDPLG
jgi:hypothetical protein